MKHFIYILLSILFFLNLNAEEKTKIKSEKFDNWFLECREINNNNNCELVQLLTINETNIQFKLLYSIFKNRDNKIKEVFTIITPLGVNLLESPKIRFDKGKQFNSKFIKCEVFGCIISISNNSNNKKNNQISDEIFQSLKKSENLEIGIQIQNSRPFQITTSLKGFKEGQIKLSKKFNR